MKFYAYIPDKNGDEPLGTENRILFELKTTQGAIKRSSRLVSRLLRRDAGEGRVASLRNRRKPLRRVESHPLPAAASSRAPRSD